MGNGYRIKTGGVRLSRMLQEGKINKPFLWIDTYNQRVDGIAGTIKARIDSNCMYFVSVLDEDFDLCLERKE